MVTLKHIDTVQQRVVFTLDPGAESVITVQNLGSAIKQALKVTPLADDSSIFDWSGFDDLDGGNKVGIVMVMKAGWTIWTEDAGSRHRFRITEGIVLGNGGADPLGLPLNVIWSLAEYTVSSILGAADVNDLASILAAVIAIQADNLTIKRFLGIGVKRFFEGGKLKITDEGKTTVVQQFSLDSTTAPTSQTDDGL